MKKLRFLFALIALSHFSLLSSAKPLQFEQSWLILENGQLHETALHYNEYTDELTVKAEGDEIMYAARQVVSFFFQGNEYYSMPFNGGFSFFKVLHEGSGFAVLQKAAGLRLLDYFVKTSRGNIQYCEDEEDPEKLVLCEGSIGPDFGMPTYSGASVQYQIQDAFFIALEGELQLLTCRYNKIGGKQFSELNLQKRNKRTFKQLKKYLQDAKKMASLKAYVAAQNLDLDEPDQLVAALQQVYH